MVRKSKGDSMKKIEKFAPEDFVVILKPHLTEELEWTGEVSVSIVTSENNDLDDDDYYGMMHFTRLLCGAIPAMDKNKTFKQECEIEANLHLPSDEDCVKDKISKIEGNVITLNFKSETEGSA
tara:strand:- start:331 stop:699 length:369 start_codon:yes stop_codon:yes gene_type:complete